MLCSARTCVLLPPLAPLPFSQLDLTASHLADASGPQLPDTQQQRRAKRSHLTPPELVLVPDGATLAELKAAVTEAFATIYRLARHWQCSHLHGLPPGSLSPPLLPGPETTAGPAAAAAAAGAAGAGGKEGAAVAAAAAAGAGDGTVAATAAAAGDSRRLVGQVVPRGCLLTAVGHGLDPEPRWVVWVHI